MLKNQEIVNLLARVDEDEFLNMFQEYVKAYGRLAKEPSMRDHLKRVVHLWFRIEELEKMLDTLVIGSKEWSNAYKNYMEGITQWSKLLTRMGTTYTSQNYIPVDERESTAISDIAGLTDKMEEFVKQKKKEKMQIAKNAGRVNHGGRRLPKDGAPINIVRVPSKKKKQKEKKAKKE